MAKRKNLLIILLIFVVIIIVVYLSLNFIRKTTLSKDSDKCLKLYTGNVVAEIQYSDDFISESYKNQIRINRKVDKLTNKPADESALLTIGSEYYSSLNNIIGASLVEPGLKYATSTFNSYDAAYGKVVYDENDIWNYYRIPFGNKIIIIEYLSSLRLTQEEQDLIKNMLDSIILTKVNDNNNDRIEDCSN